MRMRNVVLAVMTFALGRVTQSTCLEALAVSLLALRLLTAATSILMRMLAASLIKLLRPQSLILDSILATYALTN